jgi:hypothetical protein
MNGRISVAPKAQFNPTLPTKKKSNQPDWVNRMKGKKERKRWVGMAVVAYQSRFA